MDTTSKITEAVTPVKDPQSNRSKLPQTSKNSENLNPNVGSPGLKLFKSPVKKSASKIQKSGSKNPNPNFVPVQKNRIRERKFVIAKKSSKREGLDTGLDKSGCKCNKGNGKSYKCLCIAYESLRASQEEFFKDRSVYTDEKEIEDLKKLETENVCEVKVEEDDDASVISNPELTESGKRRRDKVMEQARQSLPEEGSVMHLVKAFEKYLSIPKSNKSEEKEDENSSSPLCQSDFFLTSENLGLDPRRSYSLDSEQGSFGISNRSSGGSRRSRRKSDESSVTFARRQCRRRQHKATTSNRPKPFKLRTEERGKCKEEEFMKKLQQMLEEEEKLRIPVAQGLPWTTDEPECLVKPPVKEITRPVDLVLHSDVRAVDRAEFDQQVSEKISLIEQYRMERERQERLAEEEEIRRLRKELVPKAQPMPYFDRPFIPKRSEKHPTIPKEPKFHNPHHKKIKCSQTWNDMYIYSSEAI